MSVKTKYRFENPENTGRLVRCPHCGELLSPQDLEGWIVCPYCNGKLENTPELEDFVLEPLVRQWIGHINR